jgi:hypothetical protein
MGKLTDLKVKKAKLPGVYGDGGGLYLRVTPDGGKQWIYRFMLNGRGALDGPGPVRALWPRQGA